MTRKRAVLLSQGDEVITGQTLDRNAHWLSEKLTELGFDVVQRLTVGDRLADLKWALDHGCEQADLLISTGGLGPTQDDLTLQAVSELSGDPLVLHSATLEHIQALYRRLGREMPDTNRKQAVLPSRAQVLQNDWGTAPGIQVQHKGCQAFFVPGVPREMRKLWEHRILPMLIRDFELSPERLLVFRCMGVGESRLAELLAPLASREGVVLGFRTMVPENQVKLRLDPGLPQSAQDQLQDEVMRLLGKVCFGVNCGPLPQVIGELLAERGQTLATAESCTGGRVSAQLTGVPGASRYFLQGVCAYANQAKTRLCGVPESMLQEHGAVSKPVAIALAEGIRDAAGSDYGLSTTGIAGPGGGTPDKPVGTVHIACATPRTTHHLQLKLHGDRERIVSLSVGAVLDMLRRDLQGLI